MTTNIITPDSLPPVSETQERSSKSKAFTRHLPAVARILLGFLFFISGVTGLLHLTPPPPPNLPEAAVAFDAAMLKTGYMFPLIFGTQAIVGALLLSNRFVPLALALIAPFIVNSLAFHLFLVPSGLGIIAFLLVLELYLAWTYRNAYRPMLAMRTTPNATPTAI